MHLVGKADKSGTRSIEMNCGNHRTAVIPFSGTGLTTYTPTWARDAGDAPEQDARNLLLPGSAQRDMEDTTLSQQSHRASEVGMLQAINTLASVHQGRYSAVGARWDVSNLQRAICQISDRAKALPQR